jgi:hypothetical protein
MNLRSFIVVVACALASVAVEAPLHAQTGEKSGNELGLYLNPIAMRIGNSVADHGTYAFLGQYSKSQIFYGVNMGVYYDLKIPYPFKVGLELRDSYLHGSGAVLNNFLVGVRLVSRPLDDHFKVYIEPFLGDGKSGAPFTVFRIGKIEYGAFAGVDYQTHKHIDFRLLEVGYASLDTISSETVGGTGAVPSSNILSFTSGLVFRFP